MQYLINYKFPFYCYRISINAKKFNENLRGIDFIQTQKEIGVSSWFGFSLLIKDSKMKAWLNMTIQNNNKPEENTPLRDKIKDFLTNQEK